MTDRARRYGWPIRGDAGRKRELGEGGPRQACGHGGGATSTTTVGFPILAAYSLAKRRSGG